MAHDPARRLRQLQRVLLLIELLSPLRYGATVNELNREVADEIGDFSWRTIQRDLMALEILGLVEQRPSTLSKAQGDTVKWVWTNNPQRGRVLQHAAELCAAG
tara:strand:- start:755 stop:1063 length:309 start_codon:yes stop_codon:yes gene_type:complete